MERVFDDLDEIDRHVAKLEQKIDHVLETDGPQAHELKKLQGDLAAAKRERSENLAAIDAASAELKLKKAKAAPVEAPAKR